MFGTYHQEFLKKKIKFILNVNAFGHKYFINKKILDVGSGNGDLSAAFSRLGNNVTALDARKEHLQNIYRRYPSLKAIRQDLDFQPCIPEKYDIIFHIGTLCHIVKWEENLRSACSNSVDLILETAVADVDSEFECETFEDSRIFDRSYGGKGSRPSSIKVERVISESGMFSCRLDLQELNYQSNVYDWKIENSGKKEIFLRRFWICSKNKATIEKICKKYKVNLMEPAVKKEELPKKIIISRELAPINVENVRENNAKLEIIETYKPAVQEIDLTPYNKIESPGHKSSCKIEEVPEIKSGSKNISIIIPAFNSSKFIDECVNSIKNQKFNSDMEILIGVDGCESTLEHIKNNSDIYKDCNIFWFEKNVGPYVVKNSLVDVAKYENILFFDSDDIMIDGALQKIYENIENCIITFEYYNFNNNEGLSSAKIQKRFAEGVFFVKKGLFNSINGFESWKCAADTEFHERARFNKLKYKNIKDALLYRRIHNSSLTTSASTGYRSALRNKFIKAISEKRNSENWNLKNKFVEKYEKIKLDKIEDKRSSFDICVIISSYNRKEKLKKIIDKLYWDECKYSFKIILLNDGSKEDYSDFKSYNLVYLENKENNGKFKYWESITSLLQEVSKYCCKYVIQIDDDFKLIDNFLEKTINFYLYEKNKDIKVSGIHYHLTNDKLERRWGLDHWIDGGCMLDINFIKLINYKIEPIPMSIWKKYPQRGSGVWQQVSNKICKFNLKISRPSSSYAIHNGNYDSKMNANIRTIIPIVTESDKAFTAELDKFINKINKKENFALTRYGDGELLIIKNMVVGTGTQAKKVDKWDFNGQELICKDLGETLNNNYNNYYYGIPCPCCNVWATEEYRKMLNICNPESLTYANIFVNGNYNKWFEYVKTILKESIAIVNENGKSNEISNMVKKIYYVKDDCANWYETDRENILKLYREISRNNENETFLISAGPLSEIIIHNMYHENKQNRYIDVGSSLDTLIHGKNTRKYQIKGSERSAQICKWVI